MKIRLLLGLLAIVLSSLMLGADKNKKTAAQPVAPAQQEEDAPPPPPLPAQEKAAEKRDTVYENILLRFFPEEYSKNYLKGLSPAQIKIILDKKIKENVSEFKEFRVFYQNQRDLYEAEEEYLDGKLRERRKGKLMPDALSKEVAKYQQAILRRAFPQDPKFKRISVGDVYEAFFTQINNDVGPFKRVLDELNEQLDSIIKERNYIQKMLYPPNKS